MEVTPGADDPLDAIAAGRDLSRLPDSSRSAWREDMMVGRGLPS